MERLFDKTATIKRQIYVDNKSTYANVGTISCNLQPMDNEMSKINDIQIGRGFMLFCRITDDVRETDILIIDTKEYMVKGITDYQMKGIEYKKVMLVRGI